MASANSIRSLSQFIHQFNILRGWWTDLSTMKPTERNDGELIALIMSEVGEAMGGLAGNLNDDKLPAFPMYDVELADIAVRLLDTIGARCQEDDVFEMAFHLASLPGTFIYPDNPLTKLGIEGPEFAKNAALIPIFLSMCNALEGVRKNDHFTKLTQFKKYHASLMIALFSVFRAAHLEGVDFFNAFVAKVIYNVGREDHKLENRFKARGKKF